MTTARPGADVIRLRITCLPTIDTEAPYVDDDGDGWSRPAVDGSLALDIPLGYPGPPPRLRLVAPDPTPPADPSVAQARLWEDDPGPGTAHRPEPDAHATSDDDGGDDLSFEPVPTPRPALPPPGPHAASLVRAVLEVLSGDRSLRQLARCTSTEVYDDLETLVASRSTRPWAGSLRRLVLCEPVLGVAEVAAVVVQGARTVAMAMRLEGMDGRWQVTALRLG